MKPKTIKFPLLIACAFALLSSQAQAAFLQFYADRNYAGATSQSITTLGSYTLSQMAAKGVPNDWAESLKMTWPGYSVIIYPNDNFGGTGAVYSEERKVIAGGMSSFKFQAGVPSGHVYRVGSGNMTEFQAGFIFGDWCLMYSNSFVQIKSSGSAKYTIRYETEYWVGSGALVPPDIHVESGSQTLNSTSGTSNKGTCTGTAFPQEAYYTLNGQVRVTNHESGCSYNLAVRDQW